MEAQDEFHRLHGIDPKGLQAFKAGPRRTPLRLAVSFWSSTGKAPWSTVFAWMQSLLKAQFRIIGRHPDRGPTSTRFGLGRRVKFWLNIHWLRRVVPVGCA